MDVREKLVELLTEFYGCDPMYYDVDALAIAQHLVDRGVIFQNSNLIRTIEQSYKNGYDKGYADAMRYATEEAKEIGEQIKQIDKTVKELFVHLPQPPKGE